MSEKCTNISLKKEFQDPKHGSGSYGFTDWGEKTFEQMHDALRWKAEYDLQVAQAILSAKPEDFSCKLVRGVWVQHFIKDIHPV